MAVHDITPIPLIFETEEVVTDALTAGECQAVRAAAEAEGFSEGFAELLCQFAELMGPDQVILELGRLKDLLKEDPPH